MQGGSSEGEHRGLGPVGGSERVSALDAARGFAVLGILSVNVLLFYGPDFWLTTSGEQAYEGLDRGLAFFIAAFAEGKFINTLAALFGLGVALQAARAVEQGRRASALIARRMAALLVIGVVHALLIWSGDILLLYASLGFFLIPFALRRVKTLLIWAVFIFGVPALLISVATGFAVLASLTPEGAAAIERSLAAGGIQDFVRSSEEAYTSGSYREMVAQRVRDIVFLLSSVVFLAPTVFSMMLLGIAAARAGWARNPRAHLPGIRRVALFGFAFGLPLNLLFAVVRDLDASGIGSPAMLFVSLSLQTLAPPLLSLGYAALVVLLFLRSPDSAFGSRLAAVGRMSLTNYLAQSVIMTSIFYGLALYGEVSLAVALMPVVLIWALELAWSKPILERYNQGPVERIWRAMTYGRTPQSHR